VLATEALPGGFLTAARAYAAQGWAVMPIYVPDSTAPGGCSCGRPACDSPAKHPTSQRGVLQASRRDRQLESWAAAQPEANIGIRTGADSDLIVLDIDTRHGGLASLAELEARHGALPPTRRSQTGSGGFHYLFRHPGGGKVGNSVGSLAAGVDVRGDGGYIVAPPSLHVNGTRYAWLDDAEPAALPEAWIVLLPRPRDPALAVVPTSAPDSEDGPYWLDQALLRAREGNRNATGFWLACQLRDCGLDEATTGEWLMQYAQRLGGDYTQAEALHSAGSAFKQGPRERAKGRSSGPPVLVRGSAYTRNEYGDDVNEETGEIATDALPVISVTDRRLRDLVRESIEALGTVESLYQRGGVLLRLKRDDLGRCITDPLDIDALRGMLERSADYVRYDAKRKKNIPVAPPLDVVRDVQALPDYAFRHLAGIVETPTARADGTILDSPGYDEQSRLFYEAPPGLCIPPIPRRPSLNDVCKSVLLFDELLVDFPFADAEMGRAHAIALLLTPFVREMIHGPTPLVIIDAPGPGSGKGLLADMLCMPAFGPMVGNLGECGEDPEWRKQITSVLLDSTRVVRIDNIAAMLDSPSLARALTTLVWEDRVLGGNKMARIPVRCTWMGTGNNVSASSEIRRRIVPIRLDPNEERPELRQGFKHRNLHAWARSKRGELIAAALTLVRAWHIAGHNPGKAAIGSYEEWSAVLGGILETAGVDGFLANTEDQYDPTDSEMAVWQEFIHAWWASHKQRLVLTKDLLELAWQCNIPMRSTSPHAQKVELGIAIGKIRGRVIAGRKVVCRPDTHTRVMSWWLNPDPHNSDAVPDEEVL